MHCKRNPGLTAWALVIVLLSCACSPAGDASPQTQNATSESVTATRPPTPVALATATATRRPFPTRNLTPPSPGLGEPCAPPCWNGLIPGVSTLEEVDWTMDHGTPKGFRSSQGDAIYFVWTKYQDSMVVVDRPTGILSFIHISPHWETPLLGDFIAQAGEPEGVALTIGRPITESTCDCATVSPDRFVPERDWARVGDTDEWDETWQPYLLTLFYPQQGIKISTYRFREDYPCICPQMPIDNRYFGTPYDPSAVLDKDEEIYPWSGFGRVDLDPARRISLD